MPIHLINCEVTSTICLFAFYEQNDFKAMVFWCRTIAGVVIVISVAICFNTTQCFRCRTQQVPDSYFTGQCTVIGCFLYPHLPALPFIKAKGSAVVSCHPAFGDRSILVRVMVYQVYSVAQ